MKSNVILIIFISQISRNCYIKSNLKLFQLGFSSFYCCILGFSNTLALHKIKIKKFCSVNDSYIRQASWFTHRGVMCTCKFSM